MSPHPLDAIPLSEPAQLLRYRDRQYAAEAMAVAILHLDLFTWIRDQEGATMAEITGHLGFSTRPVDVLLTLCVANGFLERDAADRFQVTTLATEHLVKGADWYLGPYYEPIRDTPITRDFLKTLQTGKPANWQAQDDGEDWHASMMSEEFAEGFTQLMDCRGRAFGQAMARALSSELVGRRRVLDVGGGSGIYAATMVARYPHMNGVVFEQAPVDAIARRELAKHGLADRVTVETGDMFVDPWPVGCDVFLLSNVLHDWDLPEVQRLLQKTADSMESGSLLILHEAFLREDKSGPLPVAEYSVLLATITQGRCYAPGEYGSILQGLGFDVGPYRDTIADRGFMTAIKR